MKNLKGGLIILALLFIGISCTIKEEGLSSEEAKTICDKAELVWSEGDEQAINEIIDSSYVIYSPMFPDGLKGIDSLKNFLETNAVPFPDFKLTIDEFYVKDDIIFSYWTLTATNTGPLGELPATGNAINVSGFAVSKVKNGKVYEEETFWNVLEMYQQLGFTLTPPVVSEEQNENRVISRISF